MGADVLLVKGFEWAFAALGAWMLYRSLRGGVLTRNRRSSLDVIFPFRRLFLFGYMPIWELTLLMTAAFGVLGLDLLAVVSFGVLLAVTVLILPIFCLAGRHRKRPPVILDRIRRGEYWAHWTYNVLTGTIYFRQQSAQYRRMLWYTRLVWGTFAVIPFVPLLFNVGEPLWFAFMIGALPALVVCSMEIITVHNIHTLRSFTTGEADAFFFAEGVFICGKFHPVRGPILGQLQKVVIERSRLLGVGALVFYASVITQVGDALVEFLRVPVPVGEEQARVIVEKYMKFVKSGDVV